MAGIFVQQQSDRSVTILFAQCLKKHLEVGAALTLANHKEPLSASKVHRTKDHPTGIKAAEDHDGRLALARPTRS